MIYTRNVTKVWVGFCLLNAVLSYTTVRSGNLEIWTLYNGVISYGLMGILLGGEFLFRSFYKKSQHKKAFENFTPLSHLHQKKGKDWAAYWQSQETVCRHYPAYIAALTLQIKASKMKRIFLISEDRALFLASFLATLRAGKILILPSSHKPDLLKSLLKKGDLILSDQKNINSLNCPFIALDKITPFETFHRAKRINPKKAGIIFYTSGSSGTPKPIGKNLSQLEEEVKELQKTWPLKPNRNTALFSTVPHHHLYGFLFSLLWPASAGVPLNRKTISHWDEFNPVNTQENILISSPAHLKRFPDNFTAPFQRVFSSGGPLFYQNVQNSLQALGVLPTEVYGSTETGGIA
ncbi:MAG: AMP-binding protein, partial [Alphaproteobacteria bacterium]|nr:AMP-binding protein [Alphaproteobacteria bacterium]